MRATSPTRRNSALLVVLLSVQLLLMSGSVRATDGATLLESTLMRVTSPVVALARAVGGGVRGTARTLREVWIAREENRHLRREVLELRERLARGEEDALEADRLRRILDVRTDLVPQSVVARVLATGETRMSRVVVIDRGEKDGVHVDSPVVSWGGVVGRVVFVDPHHAKVLLVTDPNSGVAAIVQRSRAAGIVSGQGDGPLAMNYVSRYQDVVLGDRVVTSGMDGIFPRGLTLGRVTFVGDIEQVSMTLYVQPAIDPGAVEEVLVLTGPDVGRPLAPPTVGIDR